MNMTNDNKLPVEVATMQPQAPPPSNEVFIRVCATLYKVVDQPTINGGKVRKRIPWNMETLHQDYGKEFIKYVHKYDGFCTVPEHVNHRTVIDGFLNLYEPISYKPMKGDFPNIKKLLFHIFGEQYELGMDHLQLLYLRPVQKLPILLLVSEERNTGKNYFAIGFKNKSGGYEVRNRFFKGCMSPKDITHIRQQGEPRYTCYVFEGMMDYLSFLSLRLWKFPSCPSLEAQDYVVLNSTSNVDKAVDTLCGYERISCLLDNDDAGRKATLAIETALGYRVRDASHLYCEYKDLNGSQTT